MRRTFSLFKYLLTALPVIAGTSAHAKLPATTTAATADVKKVDADSSAMRSVNKKDLASLKALNEKYRKAKSITMDVTKDVKLGLIGSARKSSGKIQLSKGQLRMELEGSEHTLLVINTKNVFAVTYPDKALKGAALQIIKADVTSKKAKKQAQSSALANLLGPGGFLKSFSPIEVQTTPEGATFFLAPIGESDMTRAQLKVSKDQKEIRELHYWDARDNETIFTFSNIVFGTKLDSKIFNYTPPADADVMNL
jgi:outer membrane lipoprotein-sorting protein